MKKHFFIAITALTAVMASSCKKDNDTLDNPNGPWSIELTAECESTASDNEFTIELAGTGTVTIDWGDGTILKDFRMPELKVNHYKEEGEEWDEYEGFEYTHQYDKAGTYLVKIYGQDGTITLLDIGHDHSAGFSSLVLNHCSRLRYLDCFYNPLTSLNVSGCTQLEWLNCTDNQLTSLDVSGCKQLKYLFCNYNELTSLDVSKCTQLSCLHCSDNQLTSLDVSKCTKLEELDCYKNRLTSLDVSKCTKLEELYCYKNQLTSLDVSKCTQLEELNCHGNQLTSLNVSGCTKLNYLGCDDNQLTSLDVSGCTQLWRVYCYNNRLSVSAMNKIYNDLPIMGQGTGYIDVDKATAGDYYIAQNKGWYVSLR